jgi:phosphatidate cytidylyltransferase
LSRLITALVLLPIVVAAVWVLPPAGTAGVAAIVLAAAYVEYASLARQGSAGFPMVLAGAATVTTFGAVCGGIPLEQALVPAIFVIAAAAVARARPDEDVLRAVGAATLPILYLAVPLGLAVAIRRAWGAAAVLLPFLTIVVSDSAQYYAGRTFGRRQLSPVISPKKTVEGAVGGVLASVLVMPLLGRYVFPSRSLWALSLLGLLIAAAGMIGDLFESLLKRSAGVKDSSTLLPGHGGMLDRIDAFLFACPAYYLFLVYAGW